MRIGINATFSHETPTGIGVYTHEIASRLLRRDGYVAWSATDALARDFPGRVRGTFPSLAPNGHFGAHVLRVAWSQLALPALAARDGVDLVYSTATEGSLFGAPSVLTVHDVIPLVYPHAYAKSRTYLERIAPPLLRRASAIVADSAHTKADLARRLGVDPRKVRVVYPGVDHARFRPLPPGAPRTKYGRYVLVVSELRPHKNVPRALAAFDRVDGDLKLVIAGRGGGPELERALARMRRPERVVFAGYVPREEIPQLYSDAAAFLFPSLYEGFGLPPLEAMACGVPVAASNAASIPEVCGDAARTFDPEDEVAMAEAISDVLARPEPWRERGLARARLFSWDRAAEEIDALLRRYARS